MYEVAYCVPNLKRIKELEGYKAGQPKEATLYRLIRSFNPKYKSKKVSIIIIL